MILILWYFIESKVIELPLSDEDRLKLCLSDENLLKLCEIGIFLEEFYNSPRDIEWAIQKVNNINLISIFLNDKKEIFKEIHFFIRATFICYNHVP